MTTRIIATLSLGSLLTLTACLGGGGGGGGFVAEAPLENLTYTEPDADYVTHLPVAPNVATLASGEADSFRIDPALPTGLTFDTLTGEITGTPTQVTAPTQHIVTAERGDESASVTITISVRTVASAIGGLGRDSLQGVASLTDGSFVVTGSFEGDVRVGDFDITSDQGSRDIFFARMLPSGVVAWVKTAGGAGTDTPSGITALSDGGFAIAGQFTDVALFGPTEPNQKFLVSDGGADIFVARFDRTGDLVWARRAGGDDFDRSAAIASTEKDELAVTGTFTGTATFGPNELNETIFSSKDTDGFVARFLPNGDLDWAEDLEGEGTQQPQDVTTTSSGDVVVAGFFLESLVIGVEKRGATGSQDLLIARFTSKGQLEWLQTAGGDVNHIASADAIGTIDGESVVVAGFLFGKIAIDGVSFDGSFDALLVRLDAVGRLEFGSMTAGTSALPTSLSVESDNSFLIAGSLFGSVVFGPGEGNETTVDEVGNQGDGFLARYDGKGGLLWAKGVHGQETESVRDIAANGDGRLALVGDFFGKVTFGLDETNETTLESDQATQDGFVMQCLTNGEL
ncbi:MAG: Ig domain-containing protein [Planctomycetota bacterium]